ncbi:hypothetical protein [Vibrio sp. B1FLJ16]|uniref:hypothetical protein n=1 Tax=Vibrio sp. B1FLJ16 TaxID=2751178 RepID=UPI00386F3275
MSEKIRIPAIADTVMVDGCYQEERRSNQERRQNSKKWHGYERRVNPSTRRHGYKPINEKV